MRWPHLRRVADSHATRKSNLPRSRRFGSACLVAVAVASLGVSSANGQVVSAADPSGDSFTGESRLDIVNVGLENRRHAVVSVTSFSDVGRGDLILELDARATRAVPDVRIVSKHRPRKDDLDVFETRAGVLNCKGFRVTWDDAANSASIRVPARCLLKGRYGRIRARVLTELVVDQDYAPETVSPDSEEPDWAWTSWARRS